MSVKRKNSSKRELFQIRTIKVLSANFAAVDLGEEPCYTEPPEKEKHGGRGKQRTKRRAAVKTGLCKRVSAKRRLSSPQVFMYALSWYGWCRLLGGWVVFFFFFFLIKTRRGVAGASAPARQRQAHV